MGTKSSLSHKNWFEDPSKIQKIWDQIGPLEYCEWGVPRRETLSFMPEKVTDEIYGLDKSSQGNRRLREILEPHLHRHLMPKSEQGEEFFERKAKLIKWIVVEWGNIRRAPEKIDWWIRDFYKFDDEHVHKFLRHVTILDNWRASSWSKILSFADHKKYPIYDARAVTSLNIALSYENIDLRFRIPDTRNTEIPDAISKIVETKPDEHPWLGYYDYLDFVTAVVEFTHVQDALEAEMILFANAPKLAAKFVKENKQ